MNELTALIHKLETEKMNQEKQAILYEKITQLHKNLLTSFLSRE